MVRKRRLVKGKPLGSGKNLSEEEGAACSELANADTTPTSVAESGKSFSEENTEGSEELYDNTTPTSVAIDMGQSSRKSNTAAYLATPPGRVSADKAEENLFHGIYIPPENDSLKPTDLLVFSDKNEALRVLKQNRKARLRSFLYREEAEEFSRTGGVRSVFHSLNNPEKSLHKGPKSQDLVKFRKAIETIDIISVKKMIDENPRYLVGSGDTPSILQEGSRYNALHVAAKTYSAYMCHYILSTISVVDFFQRLYGTSNPSHEERINILLDLYLNMPDKGCNETPLHFASKLGALDVVKVLVCYKQCDRTRRNKDGLMAIDIACSRAPESLLCNKAEIVRALGTSFYIPILRSQDNALQPLVGEPFTPSNPPGILSPTKVASSLEVRAVAGPMTEEEARTFRKMWKTPPRTFRDILRNRPELSDPEKGLEKVGRRLAFEFHVDWKEYWPFLDRFVNLASPEGLDLLEDYIKKEFRKAYETRNPDSPMTRVDSIMKELDKVSERLRALSLDDKSEGAHSNNSVTNRDVASGCSFFGELDPLELTLRSESPMFFEGYNHVFRKKKKKAFKSVSNAMEHTCKIFANRIGSALLQENYPNAVHDICSFQVFLAGCSADRRFVNVEISKSHYRLSVIIKETLLVFPENRGKAIELMTELMSINVDTFISSDKVSKPNIKAAVICICRYTLALLHYVSIDNVQTEANADVLWSAAQACSCTIPASKVPKRFPLTNLCPRNLFMEDYSYSSEEMSLALSSSSSCSSSGSSDEYYTAPSSPQIDDRMQVDDSEEEEFMVMSETGPDVFLTGPNPTKLDKDVLEAIEHCDISPFKYPYIILWKIACTEKANHLPCEKWPTPKPPHRCRHSHS